MSHIARVSIRELIGSPQSRHEALPQMRLARDSGIALVRVSPGGVKMPAAVTLRTIVMSQTSEHGGIVDHWHVSLAPTDSEGLLRRLAAPVNRTAMSAMDVPIPGFLAARYDMVTAIQRGHDALSLLAPPRAGTFVEITYAVNVHLERSITFRASSVEGVRRARGWAKYHNDLEKAQWRARHAPFQGPMRVLGLRVWPWFKVDDPKLVPEPEIPQADSWQPDGERYPRIGEVIAAHFAEILESLWKAAFAQDEFVAHQLAGAGYMLAHLEDTQLGVQPLHELLDRLRRGKHMTLMPDPDFLEELGEDAIRDLTQTRPAQVLVDHTVEYEDEIGS